ncbi:unnamed protein product [Oreochromis niloticus]|nr:unnamed protein product [Mustela putorius furo]
MGKLKHQYQTQCSSNTFSKEQLELLSQDDMMELKELVESEGLFMQPDQAGTLTVSGLKDGVTRVMQKMSQCQFMALAREVRVREEEDLYLRVVWCILPHNGNWERLPRTANHQLENNELTKGIKDAQGLIWEVNLLTTVATRSLNRQTTKLKRLENLPDFTYPLYWDRMAANESMKVVTLESSSAEYRRVKEAFKRTVAKTVMKVGGCPLSTVYGLGTYFAVDANYSAQPTYSKPAADGSQLMFVAGPSYHEGASTSKPPAASRPLRQCGRQNK